MIPCATAITLTIEERAVLEALSRSTKSEVRMRMRARIVLLATCGTPTREIGRVVGCTTGTASKWRVRYAPAWCRDQEYRRTDPSPVRGQATRT